MRKMKLTSLCRLMLQAACIASFSIAVFAEDQVALKPPVSRAILFEAVEPVKANAVGEYGGIKAKPTAGGTWDIIGRLNKGAAGLRFKPTEGVWDFSGYSLFSIRMTNEGPGTVWVEARLENGGAVDWAHSSVSQSYLLPGESGVVTVGYPHGGHRDDSPTAFTAMAAKPNGWRSHWKPFNPGDVKGCRFVIRSSKPDIKLTGVEPYLAWRFGKEPNRKLLNLPYLDRFGQAIVFDWETKVRVDADLADQRKEEAKQLSADKGPGSFNRYGGYAAGPKLKATGYFRTEKYQNKWWLVDPEGRLFWSHGACSVSNRSGTTTWGKRQLLFAQLPKPGTAEYKAVATKNGELIDFLRLNTLRKYGEGWQTESLDITHKRMRAWGLNTLGAWSDTEMFEQGRTPFTEIVHVWHGPHSIDGAADPFEPGFEKRHREILKPISEKHRDNPWMLGVFMNNEVHWHGDMIERILESGPKQPSYQKFVEVLKSQYTEIDALNKAWQTQAKGWQGLVAGKGKAWQADRTALYQLLAERYYSVCRKAMDDLLPNHLYLGSRVHHCPGVVAKEIAKFVDVFSVNHYWTLAGTGQLPKGADLPVMITEFHFGTIDRGVLGMSLCPVHDQTQRARSYAAYVTAGLMHPNIVGTHWFAYADQSTVGRPGENYQMGLIDVTDTPYPQMTAMARAVAERMYPLRLKKDALLLETVEQLIGDAE